jgi:catechol 2,3-dioxygenase-like lactoylglutathione lyase family enzyme
MNSESEKGWITRRALLMATPAIMATPSILMAPFQAMAQTSKALIATRTLNNVMISVSDMTRSVEFYQKLFGTPVMQEDVAVFRVGDGPGFFALTAVKNGAKPDFLSYGLTVENFDPNGLMKILTDNAVQGAAVTTRGQTPEVWLPDPDGIKIQLQHTGYGYGSGPRGDILPPAPKTTAKPAFQLKTISHVTLTTTDGPRTFDFYQKLFNLRVQSKQGPTQWCFAVGPGLDTLVYNIAGHNATAKPGVNHVCYTIENFDANRVMGILADNGLEPIEYGGNPASIKPMTCRVRLRQRGNNGGGPTFPLGTAELYVNDPDNIVFQLQDVSYCGGSGALGQICP